MCVDSTHEARCQAAAVPRFFFMVCCRGSNTDATEGDVASADLTADGAASAGSTPDVASTPHAASSSQDPKDSDHFIQLKDDDYLHTSLLIPSFQIDHNRPVMFWHLHRPDSVWGSSWGYSTLHRLKPFEGLEEMSVRNTAIIDAVATAMAELLSAELKIIPPLTAEQVKRAPAAADNVVVPIFDPSTEKLASKVAAAAYEALSDVPGFTQDNLEDIIVGALKLLRDAVQADPATRRKIPLVEDTFNGALSAMIVPALRPDMLTTMYVLKEPQPKPEPKPEAAPAVEARPTATKWLSDAVTSAAEGAGKFASTKYQAIKTGATAAGARLRKARHQDDLQYLGNDSDQPEPIPEDALQQDLQWAADAAAARLPPRVRGALFGREFDGVQKACRFYEAQCGDSLHVYDVNFNLWEVVRASTAAPTFFSGETRQRSLLMLQGSALVAKAVTWEGHIASGGQAAVIVNRQVGCVGLVCRTHTAG